MSSYGSNPPQIYPPSARYRQEQDEGDAPDGGTRPKDKSQGDGWNGWLDVIETGIEAAEKIPEWAVPAAMYLYKRN